MAFGTLNALAGGLLGPGTGAYFSPITEALFDGSGNLCTSDTRLDNRVLLKGLESAHRVGHNLINRAPLENLTQSKNNFFSFDGPFNSGRYLC